jgi:phage gp36-like protein
MSQRYAEIADARRLGLGARAFSTDEVEGMNANLLAASEEADSYLANQYTLPLTAWGQDLRAAVCKIAVYEFLSVRGLNPEPGSSDGNVKDRAKDARTWLMRVGEGKATPGGIADSGTPAASDAPSSAPEVISSSSRGWSSRDDSNHRGPFVSD